VSLVFETKRTDLVGIGRKEGLVFAGLEGCITYFHIQYQIGMDGIF